MELIIAIVISVLFSIIFKNAIKSHPMIFYIGAALVAAVFASHALITIWPTGSRMLFPYMQRCLLAFGLFTVVMFIGVLPEDSRLRKHLVPIRKELSILAAIITIGHIVNYLQSYTGQLVSEFSSIPITMISSFITSLVLVILLTILTVTSFSAVRVRMDAKSWKYTQKLAYPFFLMIYLHLLLILAPSISSLDQKAFFSIVVYTVIFGSYAVLRAVKAIVGKHRNEPTPSRIQTI